MKYIDKSLRKQQGEQIVTEFLNCFYNRTKAYPNDMYKAFCSEIDDAHSHVKFRQRLIDEVLMSEQGGLCCYCMRRLSECRKITLEHIMPNHAVDKTELDKYRTRATELNGLPHSEDFKSQFPLTYPPHPHSIAYQNLVLSCDGDLFNESQTPQCCNLKRKHKFLPPFVLYSNIVQTFIYTEDGMAEWQEDPEPPESKENAMRILGLNKPILKMARRIWFFCTDNNLDPHKDNKDIVVNTMMGHLIPGFTTEEEINMLLNFKKDKYWKLLLEYDAFATINHC